MTLERFEQKHFDILSDWWKQHDHPAMDFKALSPLGVVAFDGDTPVCASFLYVMHGCNLAQIAWTTTNPACGLKTKYYGINMCLGNLYQLALENKRTNVICFSSSSGLTKLMKKQGFNVGTTHNLLAGILGV